MFVRSILVQMQYCPSSTARNDKLLIFYDDDGIGNACFFLFRLIPDYSLSPNTIELAEIN